uniref:flagellar basal body rod protein FlgB n=1 Tax=Castellaniella defragrans TaxID=75697 RepID=UPI00333E5BC5
MIDRIGKEFEFQQTALSLRQRRQEILATNIANADTPHYKARDIDFAAALRDTMNDRMRLPATDLTLTEARHIPARAQNAGSADIDTLYRIPIQPSIDGNTVDMDVERVQFADNTARYQADLTVIDRRIKSLLAAMQQ